MDGKRQKFQLRRQRHNRQRILVFCLIFSLVLSNLNFGSMLTYATIYQYISNQQTYFKRIIYLRQKYVKSSDSLAFTPPTLYFCISQTGQRMNGL